MGAPVGHPFFGNQHTDGGYVLGSYSYRDVVGDVVHLANTENVPRVSQNAVRKILQSKSGRVGLTAIAAGVCFYLCYRFVFFNKHIKDEHVAGFGLCESCNEELTSSGTAKVLRDEVGDFIVCDNCSYTNRAKYAEDKE